MGISMNGIGYRSNYSSRINTNGVYVSANDAKEAKEESGPKGKVGVNVAKRARQIAAAKTPEQVRAVMALLEKDLKDCQAGLESGMCDQAEVDKVKALIQRAQQRMGEVSGNTEATPAEEAAFTMASLL